MKKLLLPLLILSAISFAQENKFYLTKEGFTDFVITNVENKNNSELYIKTLKWLNIAYKNPDEVINSKIENEYIRFTGSKRGLVAINALGRHNKETRYSIEVSFKENRYKFDLISLEYYEPASQYTRGGWVSVDLKDTSYYFKKNGELKGSFKYYVEIPEYFNNLNIELEKFIKSDEIPSKSDEW